MKIFKSTKTQFLLAVALVFFLFSGQGLRYLMGLYGYGILALVLIGLVSYSFYEKFKIHRVPVLLVAFLALAGISMIWTQTPLVTLVALGVLSATTFVALALTFALSKADLLLSIFRGLQLSLVLGMLFELYAALIVRGPIYPLFHEWLALIDSSTIAPSVLQWTSGGLFSGVPLQGFVGNRNLFGFIALLVGILAPIVYHEKLIKLYDAVPSIVLAIFVHLLTGSATVTFIAVGIGVLFLAAFVIRGAAMEKRRWLSWLFVTVAIGLAFIAYLYRDVVTLALGRSPDLTNRTDIWKVVFEAILEYPQGTGWVSYWPIWEEPYKSLITLGGTPIAHAHNAFLDVWLQLGPLAVIVLLGIFATTLISGWEVVETGHHGDTLIPLAWVFIAVALGLQGISESRLLLEGNWFLLVVTTAAVPQIIRNRGKLQS